MKRLFFALALGLLLVGCKSSKKPTDPVDTTGWSADFPTVEQDDGRAMPEYIPYWKK